jgi:hypothetical protein
MLIRQITPLNYEVQLPGVRKSELVHVERMKKFVELTAPVSSEEGAESSMEGTVDFEIQKKVSWADEMDQRTGPKEAEDEESWTDDQERAKRITRGEGREDRVRFLRDRLDSW